MRTRAIAAIVFVVLGLAAGAASVFMFGRAADSETRMTRNRETAQTALAEAGRITQADPARHRQLTADGQRYSAFAEDDTREHQSQIAAARYSAAAAALCVAAALGVVLVRRRATSV